MLQDLIDLMQELKKQPEYYQNIRILTRLNQDEIHFTPCHSWGREYVISIDHNDFMRDKVKAGKMRIPVGAMGGMNPMMSEVTVSTTNNEYNRIKNKNDPTPNRELIESVIKYFNFNRFFPQIKIRYREETGNVTFETKISYTAPWELVAILGHSEEPFARTIIWEMDALCHEFNHILANIDYKD